LTEQQPKQQCILYTKIDYNNSTMLHRMFLLPSSKDNIRHFGDHSLSSRNQSVSQPVFIMNTAKFNAAGARPTLDPPVRLSATVGGSRGLSWLVVCRRRSSPIMPHVS